MTIDQLAALVSSRESEAPGFDETTRTRLEAAMRLCAFLCLRGGQTYRRM